MTTNVRIDDLLVKDAMTALGVKTKREATEKALQDINRIARQREIVEYRGKLTPWEGDLEAMRLD